jgi:hypothetical protein
MDALAATERSERFTISLPRMAGSDLRTASAAAAAETMGSEVGGCKLQRMVARFSFCTLRPSDII